MTICTFLTLTNSFKLFDQNVALTLSLIHICTNVFSFRIALDRNFARQGEQRQADFIDIVAWRQQADFACKYFQKGSLIAIEGSLHRKGPRLRREDPPPGWGRV